MEGSDGWLADGFGELLLCSASLTEDHHDRPLFTMNVIHRPNLELCMPLARSRGLRGAARSKAQNCERVSGYIVKSNKMLPIWQSMESFLSSSSTACRATT